MPTTITTNDTTRFARYVYAYKYDDRGRVKEKHTPGAGWTYIVYNKIDNPILTQDADQRTRNEWIFSKYDEFGRIAVTGLYENSSTTTQAAMQTLADGTAYTLWETRAVAANSDWTATAFPTSSTGTITIHNVNYYDRYDFPGKESFTGMGADLTRVQGLLTGSKTTVLDASPYNLTNTVYYDTKGRVVQTIINQPKVGNDAVKDVVSNTYSFTGQLLTTTRKQTKGGTAMFTLATTNNYDHAGRLKTVQQKMDNDPNVTVASNIYNALGQLKQIKLHQTGGNLPAETIDYEYNIRGWLTSIASQNFSELLYYNTVISGFNTNSQWGGNISAVEWKAPAKDGEWHVYKYNYDNLNRLTEGVYTRRISTPGGIIYTGVPGMFNESFSYDNKNMGNIDKLNRYHGNPLDKSDALTYTYNGNQVTKIEDASTSTSTVGFPNGTANYTYNEAGRLKKDDQKGITAIAYNHLGLPTKIEKGSSSANHLVYTYDGTGRKLAKQLGSGTKRYYIDGVEYENANLQFISTPYGRIRKETSGWQYDYFLKDHLGNVRVVLEAGTAGGSRGGDNTAVYIATMEESRAAEESQYFENVDATRADRPFNYPDKNPTNAKVSKVPGKSEGLKLTLKVMAGDTIEISIWGNRKKKRVITQKHP